MTCQRCNKPLSGRQAKWCSESCRKRACDESHRASCVDCGAKLHSRSGWPHGDKPRERCRVCHVAFYAKGWDARIEDVAEMYREGLSLREIAVQLGYGPNSVPPEVTVARRRGLIGSRRTPEQIARIREGRWGRAA